MPIVNLQLIYNVGMNNGDDTAFYLPRGFRVIGIEPGLELRLRHLLFGSLLDSRPLRFALALLGGTSGILIGKGVQGRFGIKKTAP